MNSNCQLIDSVTNVDLGYDLMGNVQSKTGIGTYTYHATKKHQVTSTGNGWSFGYDNNGNMTSGRGATIGWTSYNYPSSITNGSNTSTFEYTPDRQYFRQIANYASGGGTATTLYIGGIYERVTTSTGTEFRHYIRAGNSTVLYSRTNTGVTTVKYITSDHLGSNSAVTNSSGGVLMNSSFDAFGKRRGANWTGAPSAADWTEIASSTRRGYTEHTMLDNLTLTHMNGRVYDQELGRFLSADPFIPDVADTQSFNRYSYTTNRPLSFVDPSGFEDVPPACLDTRKGCAELLSWWNSVGGDSMCITPFGGMLTAAACAYMSGSYGSGGIMGQSEAARRAVQDPLLHGDGNPPSDAESTDRVGDFIWENSGLKLFDCYFRVGGPKCNSSEWWDGGSTYAMAILPVKGLGLLDDAGKMGTQAARAVGNKLPANARTTLDPKEIYRRLEKFHGIDPAKAGDRLHDIKRSAGMGPADNVVFDLTGNVYDKAGNWLGSLTMGGK